MKKLNVAAVFVLLMVSATNVFADANCAQLAGQIAESKINIAQGEKNVAQLEEYSIHLQTQIIENQIRNKEEPFILGAGQPRLQADSAQAQKIRALTLASIRREEAKIQADTAEYMKECSNFDKFE